MHIVVQWRRSRALQLVLAAFQLSSTWLWSGPHRAGSTAMPA
jgi:hypothetical protein